MNLTINKIEFDKDLVKLVSYLTFDGHLAEDLKCFYLSSKNKHTLLDFKEIVHRTFKINGRIEEGMGFGESYKYRVFNKDACKFLEKIGVPKGSKVLKNFLIPKWIVEDKEFSGEYLRIAFDCEGSIWFENKPKIRFGVCKSEQLIENGLIFLEQMKMMLKTFEINSTETWLIKGNQRRDGNKTKGLYFKIKQDSIKSFANEVGFNDIFKNQRLSLI